MPVKGTKSVYLDYAAATPIDPLVLQAMQPYFTEQYYNPSASYLAARDVRAVLDQSRSSIARIIGARPGEVIFTAGGTEANNLAIHGIMQDHPDANIVVSAIEHESVREPAKKYTHLEVPVTPDGIIDIGALGRTISDQTVLVSIMLVNNEVGSIQPIREVAAVIAGIREHRKRTGSNLPIYLHTDACQAANYLELQVHRLGVDLMTLNGSKIYGPKQSGILYVRSGVQVTSLLQGGGQEMNKRSGTENVAAIIGFSKALEVARERKQAETERIKQLQGQLIEGLSVIPGVRITGSVKQRIVNNVHCIFPGVDNERLIMELDERGIQVAAGSACSASKDEPSHVLAAMGLSTQDIRSSIRFTLGRGTQPKDIAYLLTTLRALLP